ncbi:MAG: hypothetical protein JSS78_03315 [Bacteroidetes bacterium]|nr:hypothetical protein [Bacteroidota bacterium]
MWHKFLFYLKRYGVAELVGGLIVIIISSLVYYFSGNKILAAYAGAFGENIGFYGAIIFGDIYKARKQAEHWSWSHIWRVLRNVMIEFGGAEFLDSLLVRPGFIFLGTTMFENYQLGALCGVVAADIVFYGLAVLSSELTKRFRK